MTTRSEVLKHYYKWKSIATVGIWIGAGIGTIHTGGEQVGLVFILAFFATAIVWLAGSRVE